MCDCRYISPDDCFGRRCRLLSTISTCNPPELKHSAPYQMVHTYTVCTMTWSMYSSSTCCLLLLYVVDCTVYNIQQYSRHHVLLLYMVHCHCAGQMNDCTKYAHTATHLILSQGPFLTLGVPMQCKDGAISAPSPPVRMEW